MLTSHPQDSKLPRLPEAFVNRLIPAQPKGQGFWGASWFWIPARLRIPLLFGQLPDNDRLWVTTHNGFRACRTLP